MPHFDPLFRTVPLRTRMFAFPHEEGGAVTVDMLGLMSAAVVLGLAVPGLVGNGVESQSTQTSQMMATAFETGDSSDAIFGALVTSSTSTDPGSPQAGSPPQTGTDPVADPTPVQTEPPSRNGRGSGNIVRISARVPR